MIIINLHVLFWEAFNGKNVILILILFDFVNNLKD
jgi:hypothetical protein